MKWKGDFCLVSFFFSIIIYYEFYRYMNDFKTIIKDRIGFVISILTKLLLFDVKVLILWRMQQ